VHFAEYVVVGVLLGLIVGGGVVLTGAEVGGSELAGDDVGGGATPPPEHETVAFCRVTAVCA